MADLSLLFPGRRPVRAAGVLFEVEQLRLRDLARLESLVSDPDPLAGRRTEIALALAECGGDCLDRTEAGATARRLLKGIFPACDGWSPTLSSPEARRRLRTPEGMIAFLWVLLGRGRDDFGPQDAHRLLAGCDAEAWQELRSAAYGVDPVEEWADWVSPGPAGRPKQTWCEAIVSLMGEPPDPSRLQAIGDMYLSQYRIISSRGQWKPGQPSGEKGEVREINRRKRIVLAEPGENGVGH